MIEHLALQVYDLWRYGGAVMPALIATAFALVAARLLDPDRPGRGIVDEAARRGVRLWIERGGPVPRARLDEAFGDLESALTAGTTLVTCLIAMSPLLGLLGTVTGLIEIFGFFG